MSGAWDWGRVVEQLGHDRLLGVGMDLEAADVLLLIARSGTCAARASAARRGRCPRRRRLPPRSVMASCRIACWRRLTRKPTMGCRAPAGSCPVRLSASPRGPPRRARSQARHHFDHGAVRAWHEVMNAEKALGALHLARSRRRARRSGTANQRRLSGELPEYAASISA